MASSLCRLVRSSSTIKHYLLQAEASASRPIMALRNIRTYATESREPCMSSVSIFLDEGKYFSFNCPGLTKTESDEHLCVFANMHGLEEKNMKAPRINGNTHLLSIVGQKFGTYYYAGMELPENVDGVIKTEMQGDGTFKLTLPKLKDRQLKMIKRDNIFTAILTELSVRLIFSVIITCARYIVMSLCPWWFDSITMCKKVTPKSLHVSCMPGIDKVEVLTTKGLSVSLNMPELKIEDVKSFVKSDFLFIEGKTKSQTNKVHYITGIRLPEFFKTKRSKIKIEMQDGTFKITLPKAKED